MIKLFVKNTQENNPRIGYHHCMLFGQESSQRETSNNKVLRNLLCEKTNSYSKFMGIRVVLQSDTNLLKTQIQKKGFDQKLVKYLLEPDDTYLQNMVNKPYE